MKKLFSLVFITLLILNVLGYYGVFLGLQYRNDIAVKQKFNTNNYPESQTITLKIPLAVPYMSDQNEFVRVDGDFEYKGEFYRLVKQRYLQDTLTVICFKDRDNKRIHQALSNYVKTFSDKATNHQPNTKLTINFIKDYIPQNFTLKPLAAGWQSELVKETFCRNFIPSFTSSIVHPPERG